MKQKQSMVKTVFGTIDTIISTTHDIHSNIAGVRESTMNDPVRHKEQIARVYDTVKSVSGSVEKAVLSFFN
jgi:hypothetical protein